MHDASSEVDVEFENCTGYCRRNPFDVADEYDGVVDEAIADVQYWADEMLGVAIDTASRMAIEMKRRAAEEHDQLCTHLIQELVAGRCEPGGRLASTWQSTVIKHALAMSGASESANRYQSACESTAC